MTSSLCWPCHGPARLCHISNVFHSTKARKQTRMWASTRLGNSPRTVLKELARIQSHDVVLPTTTLGQIRLRCVTQPDAAQAALIDRLALLCQSACASPNMNCRLSPSAPE